MVHSYNVWSCRKKHVICISHVNTLFKFENRNDKLYILTLFGAISSDILELQRVT